MHLLLTLALMACSGGWSSLEDCDALSTGANADECYATYAADLFREDPVRGEKVVNERVQDQRVRDFIWLTVTREVDPSSYKYCDRIQEDTLAERCRVLVSRPHLHRDLLRQDGEAPQGRGGGPVPTGGRPAGPPPGGAPQGGGPPPPGGAPQGGGPPPPSGAEVAPR